ncbi:Down syndrome cell adhesion molecule-like protein Dscam2 [Penaeus japonicus]|uniref:Down syndrome cell adhesion molecule-like protein Dscam2 n=1 Tax=Penaeus japonicus TaxID=27405 RepID=UPI001C70C46C|nr:Down syndrome cell adhesion molecule-like protein Dscam2 [Penaeus japonicus]
MTQIIQRDTHKPRQILPNLDKVPQTSLFAEEISPAATLVVQEFEVRVYDEYVISGNTAVLRCVVPSFVRDLVTVTAWVRDHAYHIYPSAHGDGKYQALLDGRLLVHNVEAADSYATYRCRVLHTLTATTAASNTARIIVHDPRERQIPRMVTKSTTVQISDTKPLVLPCVAHAHPPPEYRWWQVRGEEKLPLMTSSNSMGVPIGSGGGDAGGGQGWGRGGVVVLDPTRLELVDESTTLVCQASNEAGRTTMEVRIERSVKVTAHLSPRVLVVDAGAVGTLRCQVPGSHPHSISWYKDGHVLTPRGRIAITDGGSTLEVRGVGRGDAGMYQCFVRGSKDTVQDASELRLGASPPELVYKFISQTLTPGPSVSLKCIASGTPTPTITWALDGFPLPQNERLVMGQYVSVHGEVISHVNISGVRVEDGGSYSCSASNSAASVVHAAPLHVYGTPHVRPMGPMSAVAGETFRIKCPVAGYPINSITWAKGGRTLPINRRQRVSPEGELVINHVSRNADQGDYTCTASNKQGHTSSQSLPLRVVEPPQMAPFTLPGSLSAGSRVAVQCVVTQGDPPVTLSWLHDDSPATSTPGITVTPLGQFVLALLIESLRPHHAGNYTCEARSPAATATHSATLHVHVPPRWVVEPRDVSVIRGEDALLTCEAMGFPQPSVTWRRTRPGNDKNLFNNVGMGVSIPLSRKWGNGSLLISSATEEAEGSYMCEASNGVGTGLSAIINLQVHAPPVVTGEGVVEVRRGETIKLQCEARGDAPISLNVARDGKPLDTNDYRYSVEVVEDSDPDRSVSKGSPAGGVRAEVRVTNVTPQDSAVIACTATNAYGSHTHNMELKVQDVPEAPRDLRVTREGSRSVTVTWAAPPSPNTPITHYVIHLKTQTVSWESNSVRQLRTEGSSTSAVLEDLLPAKVFQVRVVAVNSVGESPSSEPLSLRTDGEAPSAAPVTVRAVGVSSREVQLTWAAPDPDTWNGQLLGYYVGHKQDSPVGNGRSFSFDTVGVTGGGEESWTVGGLEKFTRYVFVLQAFNAKGPGPLSTEVFATTLEDVPEAPPEDVTCVALTSTRVEVSWSPPPAHLTHGRITTYTLTYTPMDDHTGLPAGESRIVNGQSATVGDLERYTNYSVTVAAATRAGVGVSSQAVVCATEEDVPQAPRAVKVVVNGGNSAIVAWAAPERAHGTVTKYILYRRAPPARDPIRRILPPQTLWLEVTDLASNHLYEFWVTSATRVGEGPASSVVSVTPSATVGAGIYSMGGEVRAARGTDVVLSCQHVGRPTPTLSWRRDNAPVTHDSRYEPQLDGGLLIRDCQRSDSGNYTCHASNRHGSDHVVYKLIVMVPPAAVVLHSMGSTSNSVTVSWRHIDDGGAPVRKLTLTWRPDPGEWREVTLARHLTQYTLGELTCGTEYHLYLTSHNKIGPGAASEVITVRTKGSRPSPPPQHRLISVNTTAVTLRLASWADQQCPIAHFSVRFRPSNQRDWQMVSGRLPGSQKEYALGDLAPATSYELSVTAQNPAGETTASYNFITLGLTGDHLQEGLGSISGGRMGPTGGMGTAAEDVFTDPAFIVPVIISCIALVSIVIAITLCLRKRPGNGQNGNPAGEGGDSSATSAAENKSNLAAREQYYATVRKPAPSPIHDVNALERIPEYAEDIYPYATFQIQRQEDTLSTHFQTFVYQDPRRATVETLAYRKSGSGNNGDGREGRNGGGGGGENRGGGGGVGVGGGGESRVGVGGLERDSDEYGRVKRCRMKYGGESEDYDDSLNSDTDTDHAASSRTESSSHLDDTHHSALSSRNHHHNLLYVASDASTTASPLQERKSLPRRSRSRSSGSGSYAALSVAVKGMNNTSRGVLGGVGAMTTGGMGRSHALGPSTPALDVMEMSETECDRDNRRQGAPPVSGGRRRNTSFSIAV